MNDRADFLFLSSSLRDFKMWAAKSVAASHFFLDVNIRAIKFSGIDDNPKIPTTLLRHRAGGETDHGRAMKTG